MYSKCSLKQFSQTNQYENLVFELLTKISPLKNYCQYGIRCSLPAYIADPKALTCGIKFSNIHRKNSVFSRVVSDFRVKNHGGYDRGV